MRTTLTIDDDVAAELERLRLARDARLKDLGNDALRSGIRDTPTRPNGREPFQTLTVALGRMRVANIDNIGEALAIAESEAFK